jgi:hypothetical protein
MEAEYWGGGCKSGCVTSNPHFSAEFKFRRSDLRFEKLENQFSPKDKWGLYD